MLIAYSMASTFTPTTLEYLLALKNFTDYEVNYVHVTNGAWIDFDINDYDVVFQNYCARLCYEGYVSEHYQQALMNFRGLKILAVQDDYDRTATLHRAIRRLGFHVLLTAISREFWPIVYPRSELPGLTIVQALTGYVPERLLERRIAVPPLRERRTWVAYRGREIGAKYGRLGFEKFEIGRRMMELCSACGVPNDIAMDEASRIYGDAWFEFLGSSRTVLGSESGSNVFDFDGSLEQQIDEFTTVHGRRPTYQEFKHILDPLEAPFDVGQISPRAFESAIMMTPMILFRGRYSNAIEAGVHYIPLEKDFANAAAIIGRLDDIEYLQGFAERAYQRLVRSGEYGYRSLARLLEATIEQQYPIWIDPDWVAYRTRTARPSTRTDCAIQPTITALVERPTELPLPTEEYFERQARAELERQRLIFEGERAPAPEQQRQQQQQRVRRRTARQRLFFVARRIWRLIPARERHHLAILLRKVLAERPLPPGVSRLRPLWRLLPKPIRKATVSLLLIPSSRSEI